MKTNIVIYSEELAQGDIQLLLQAIRDCEQKHLADKEIRIAVMVPDLKAVDCARILNAVKPPFKHGPILFQGGVI
jgi:hypothetical protein